MGDGDGDRSGARPCVGLIRARIRVGDHADRDHARIRCHRDAGPGTRSREDIDGRLGQSTPNGQRDGRYRAEHLQLDGDATALGNLGARTQLVHEGLRGVVPLGEQSSESRGLRGTPALRRRRRGIEPTRG